MVAIEQPLNSRLKQFYHGMKRNPTYNVDFAVGQLQPLQSLCCTFVPTYGQS